MSLLTRLRRIVRFNYLRVLRLKTSARSIALGCALGVFVGFLPIIPFQTVVVLTLAFIFQGNKLAACLFTFVSNPVNTVPFYFLLYRVGIFFLPFENVPFTIKGESLLTLLKVGWQLVLVMFGGGLILGIPSSLLTYFIVLRFILLYRKRRALRLLRIRKEK